MTNVIIMVSVAVSVALAIVYDAFLVDERRRSGWRFIADIVLVAVLLGSALVHLEVAYTLLGWNPVWIPFFASVMCFTLGTIKIGWLFEAT